MKQGSQTSQSIERSKAHQVSQADHCRVLLAEDDYEMRKLLSWSLRKNGYEVIECADGNCIMKKLGFLNVGGEPQRFDLIVSDIRMPGSSGLQVLESAREFEDFPPIILITAFPDRETFSRAERLGAIATFAKPFDIDDLIKKIRQIIPNVQAGKAKQQQNFVKGAARVEFPLEITFRHRPGTEPVKNFIKGRAIKLNRFVLDIKHCHVVIDESNINDHKKHRYHINIIIGTEGKTIVARHDSDTGHGDENLYLAIQITFGIAYRELKQYLNKRVLNRNLMALNSN